MLIRRVVMIVCLVCLLGMSSACSSHSRSTGQSPTLTPPPTPATEALQVSGQAGTEAQLRVALPSVRLLKSSPDIDVQLFVLLADLRGTYSYLLYPANRSGATAEQFDLSSYPLDLGLSEDAEAATLWILALHNTRYTATESFGADALAASLAIGFRNWLTGGDSSDDPLAAVVSASEGALFEWFAQVEVLGQSVILLPVGEEWHNGPPQSLRSADDGLSIVYAAHYSPDQASAANLTPTPSFPDSNYPGYVLRVDEDFTGGTSEFEWYQGQDNTYANQLVEGAYEIRLTDIQQRGHGVSWGSIEGQHFRNYIVEARVRLIEEDITGGRYGIWFNYQDDYNFIYFGISNEGEYRVASIQSNQKRREIKDWTPSEIIHPGTTANILTIQTASDGAMALSINGEQVITFNDPTFDGGSVAFFCYAESVPATCHLERLRVWERVG